MTTITPPRCDTVEDVPLETRQALRPQSAQKVGYLMSRFPKLTETFVLYEILAVEAAGLQVEILPLQRERTEVMHREARPLVARARFTPWLFSWSLLLAHLHYIRRRPAVYLATLSTLIAANWGSRRYLAGAIAFFPKAVLLARIASQQRLTHLHAHFASHPAAVAYVIHRLTGIPFSFTAHGSDLHRDRHMLREKVAAAKTVVAISAYNREVILKECGQEFGPKVVVIHCGVDTERFRPRAHPTPFERQAGPFAIVCTGSLHAVKGQRVLLSACRRLRDEGHDFVCHFAGDGPDRRELEAFAEEAGLASRVRFHGQLTQAALRALLDDADVVAAPSVPTTCGRREGIPVALMEALGSGIAAVASRLSGIPELVRHEETGLLIPPGDDGALAAALARLATDSTLRHRLARQGRDLVHQEFDLHQNATTLAAEFSPASRP